MLLHPWMSWTKLWDSVAVGPLSRLRRPPKAVSLATTPAMMRAYSGLEELLEPALVRQVQPKPVCPLKVVVLTQ